MATFVIAEVGSCHDNDLEQALGLVHTAAAAGADAAKFQYWSSAERMAERRHAEEYEAVYRRYQLPLSWLAILKAECDAVGIEFLCSTYLPEDVDRVAPFVRRFKVASFEANDPVHLAAHSKWLMGGRDVLVSLGMGADAKVALGWLRPAFLSDKQAKEVGGVTFLHCVSSYPAPLDQLALARIRCTHRSSNPDGAVGFSDHADRAQVVTGAFAVLVGATLVERHLRSERTTVDNPDAPHAMSPVQFAEYVSLLRDAEQALGSEPEWHQQAQAQACEAEMQKFRTWSNEP